ncbi:hypothetical protein FSP39_005798 [Pinctada imbricata]|uniref:Heat shock 70 kDa protein n=1 Tax=Pinctada imbricata TaxID=66713 RepID=A0AA89BSC4_PINIB|nr:hypothetical protein FSP39_005798 [Pinctada imbricata]
MSTLMVAAIDFGTTFSGYAFAFKADLQNDKLKIQTNQAWNGGQQKLISLKTPTCLLLDRNRKFVSFGYEAETEYTEILLDEDKDHNDFYYFNRFKMELHGSRVISTDMKLREAGGKELRAMTVFSESIGALKKHLDDLLDLRGTTIDPDEIEWVLTVPAIWTDSAKQFMRKACVEAGIKDHLLRIALEPEAASIYCQHLPTERLGGAEKGFSVSTVGTRYMVIDLGGGTADITVHEKLDSGRLREIYRASGGASGGTAVDECFLELFRKLFGNEVMQILKDEKVEAYTDLVREFEVTKRNVKPNNNGKISMMIPYITIEELCQSIHGKGLKEVLAKSVMAKHVGVTGNKLRFESQVMEGIFRAVTSEIIEYITLVLGQPEVQGVERFLLVGGFSESAMVQNAIRDAFPGKRLIIPDEPGLAVLKGAVLYGNEPQTISERSIKYSYGVKTAPEFDEKKHDPKRKFESGGKTRCSSVFSSFMHANTVVPINAEVVKKYQTNEAYQKILPIEVFYSISDDPRYTDESCVQRLGIMEVEIPNPSKERRKVEVHFFFGGTEMEIVALDLETNTPCEYSFNLLS